MYVWRTGTRMNTVSFILAPASAPARREAYAFGVERCAPQHISYVLQYVYAYTDVMRALGGGGGDR